MSIMPKNVVKGLKTASNISGNLVKGRAEILYNLDLQWKNLFEVIFYPHTMGKGLLNMAKSIGGSLADTAVTSVMVKSIEGITFPSFEYEDLNGVKHITGITFPEEVSMTFIEDQTIGVVRNFCDRWVRSIMVASLPNAGSTKGFLSGVTGGIGKANEVANSDDKHLYYVFKDKQAMAKKNATIILKRSDGLPSIGGWIKLEGLKIKTYSGFDLAQDSAEPMEITVTMAVDNVKLITPMNLMF